MITKVEAKTRIEKLKKTINHHRYLYHVLSRQEISEAALDSLKRELYKLEQQFPEFITSDSPTQRVEGALLEDFGKVEHEFPMLSLEDVFGEKELKDWEKYLQRLEPSAQIEFFSELKIDGFAITLIYENGIFNQGATRGNGRVGEDVTQNLKTIESIPLKLEIKEELFSKEIEKNIKELIGEGKIEIRGEVYMEKKAFEKLNAEMEKRGETTYSNPRNLAAGSIRQLDPKLVASRPLKFLAYDIITDFGQKKHSEKHQILKALGFKVDEGKICKNLGEVVEFWQEISKKRESLPFLIDGVVINVNDNLLFKKIGVVGKAPRGARAFKFSPKQAATIVEDIKFQVGRTGAITPVAVLRQVEVEGVTITRATLHNEDEIKKLGVKIGDTVIIERAGDVIPAVVKVLTELRTGKEKHINFPKKCPVCNFNLLRPVGEVVWRCKNPECSAKKREFLYHFVSKKAFDIDGLGPKIIDQLVEENLVSQPLDLFSLKERDLVPLEMFAEKKAKNIIETIGKSKKIPLAKFIYSLGIFHVGEETAADLAMIFGSIEKIKKAKKEELEKIPDVGGVISKSIYFWFQQKINQKMIEDLISAGIKIMPPAKTKNRFSGKTFVLTGGLDSMSREETREKIRFLGGDITESVSKKTDFLVFGKEPGSKFDKAKKLGVKTINEKEFLEMIQ